MKCRAWVIEQTYRTKGKGIQKVRVKAIADAYPREHFDVGTLDLVRNVLRPTPPQEGATLCGGKLIARIDAEDEAYYGGTSAVLHIEYECERCHWGYHGPDLPDNSEKLSEAMTAYLEGLPEVTL